MTESARELIFLGVFALLTFGVPILVVWATYSDNLFDLSSLWTHNNRVDKFAVIIMITWWVHTTSLILWTLMQKVVTADYLTYMGWALPIIVKMLAPNAEPPKGTP